MAACLKNSHGTVGDPHRRAPLADRAARAGAIRLVLLALACSLAGWAQARVPTGAAGEFNRAIAHFRAGDYEAALQAVEPLGDRFPQAGEIQHFLAIVLDLNRRPEAANRHFRQAVEIEPESVAFRTNFGASLMRLGQAAEAADQFRKVLDLEPDHPTASFNLGTILMQQGRPEEALPWLEKAYRGQPGIYENAYQLAYCQLSLARYEESGTVLSAISGPAASRAEVKLLKALTERALGRADRTGEVLQSIKPMLDGQPQLQFQLASLLSSQGMLSDAEALLRSVTQKLPRSYAAHLTLAATQQKLGKLDEATKAARTAFALSETAEVHLLLGELLEGQEDSLEAVGHFQRAVALDPTPGNYFALGYEFVVHWNWEAAAQVFAAGIESEPDSWHLWIGAGAAALGLTSYDDATRAFLRAVNLRPRELAGYHLLAQAFDQAVEAFDDALHAFRELLARDAEGAWPRYYEALATIRSASRTGDSSAVPARIESLLQLTRENPQFLEAQLLLGEMQFKLQDWSDAAEALQASVRLDPSHVTAHYQLGIALQRLGRSQEARTMLQRYNDLKARESRTVGERVAATTRFIVEIHEEGGPR